MAAQLVAPPSRLPSSARVSGISPPGSDESPEAHADRAQPLHGRLRRGATWVILARILGVGVTMLVNVALARWLTPEEFGDFLLFCNVMSLASVLAMAGLNSAFVRFIPERLGQGDVSGARQYVRLILLVSVVTTICVTVLAAFTMANAGTKVLGLPAAPWLVPILVIGLVLLTALQLMAEGCRALHELRLASLFSGGQTGGLLSNMLLLALLGCSVAVAKPSFTLAAGLNLVAMAICLPIAILGFSTAVRDRLPVFASEHTSATLGLKPLLAFSLPMLSVQFLALAMTQADLWVAGIYCTHDQVALYGAARRLVLLISVPLQMAILTVISSVAELHAQNRHRELERVVRRAISLAAAPSVIGILVLILFGGPMLQILLGPYYRQASLPLSILSIGQLFLVCAGGSGCALEMTGHQMTSLVVNLVAAVALVTTGAWAVRHFGIVGLATASTGVIVVQSVTMWLLAKRLVGIWTHPLARPWRGLELSTQS